MNTRPLIVAALVFAACSHRPQAQPTCPPSAALNIAPTTVASAGPSTQYPPHAIPNTQIRVITPAVNGRTYQLHVHLPGSYNSEPSKRYPVMLVTDGYWDFATVQASYNNLNYDKLVPEFILVGLGYAGEGLDYQKMREFDLLPVSNGDPATTGHAAEFLDRIEHVFLPLIERDYRVDPSFRVLAGSSMGGLFTLYAMYARPSLFQGHIAVGPYAEFQKEWLLAYDDKFAKSKQPIKTRLYMTAAAWEWRGFRAATERLDRQLTAHQYEGLKYQFRLLDDTRHAGAKAEGYTRGMQFVFAPLAPESGQIAD